MNKIKAGSQPPMLAAKVLDAMPAMVGAIDRSFLDAAGEKVAFVVVAFVAGTAVHATNIVPAADAMLALAELVHSFAHDGGATLKDGNAAG